MSYGTNIDYSTRNKLKDLKIELKTRSYSDTIETLIKFREDTLKKQNKRGDE